MFRRFSGRAGPGPAGGTKRPIPPRLPDVRRESLGKPARALPEASRGKPLLHSRAGAPPHSRAGRGRFVPVRATASPTRAPAAVGIIQAKPAEARYLSPSVEVKGVGC
jgi:hypothetical protein